MTSSNMSVESRIAVTFSGGPSVLDYVVEKFAATSGYMMDPKDSMNHAPRETLWEHAEKIVSAANTPADVRVIFGEDRVRLVSESMDGFRDIQAFIDDPIFSDEPTQQLASLWPLLTFEQQVSINTRVLEMLELYGARCDNDE